MVQGLRVRMNPIVMEQGWDEHFAYSLPRDDRSRASKLSPRNGRTSPTNSAHGNLLRHSLLRITEDKRAKKVRFYRNGDRFFKGMVYAVSPERFRTFESLMANLTESPVGDKNVLPNGVRHIFSIDGSRKIVNLDQLQEGESYVCASTDVFKRAEYDTCVLPAWNVQKSRSRDMSVNGSTERLQQQSTRDYNYLDESRDYIKPKLVTIIRNGPKPRKAVRVLLNRKTAHSFDQVLTDITDAIKLDTGAVKRIFTLDGRPVQSLSDFFKEDSIFVAYGPERFFHDDFDLDDNEVKYVTPYKARSAMFGDRVTLRSAKLTRRSSSGRNLSEESSPTSPRNSPKMSKKLRAVSAPKYRVYGNGDGEEYQSGPPSLSHTYEIGKKIGEGNFSIVKECKHRHTNKRYALKIIEKEKCRGKEHMIKNEVSILKSAKHPNIIEVVDEFDSHTELYLVMELVKGGDLFDAISMSTKYTEKDACAMIFNLASALEYLHSRNIVHRDIKPENLLVCDHGDGSKSLKLGDFGLATYCTEPLFIVCGTPTYVAPEILAETGYGTQVDVWAAGIIMYILLCGFPPFSSATNNQEELFDKILDGHFEFMSPYWDGISDLAKDLISNMLMTKPEERYTAADVTKHDWLTAEEASDKDIHSHIAKEIKSHFKRKPKPSSSSAGIRLVATTALDKGSRYFEGRKPQLTLPEKTRQLNGDVDEDEIF